MRHLLGTAQTQAEQRALRSGEPFEVDAELRDKIVRRYETEARRLLDAGDAARAAELAGYGLKIQPARDSLLNVKSEAEAAANPATK